MLEWVSGWEIVYAMHVMAGWQGREVGLPVTYEEELRVWTRP